MRPRPVAPALLYAPLVLGALIVVAAETGRPAPDAPPRATAAAKPDAAEAAALGRAQDAARTLGGTFRKRLVEAIQAGGPAAGAEVCANEATKLREEVEARTGVRVGRASLKLRNPANAPEDWVRAWLVANDGRPAAEATPLDRIDTVDGRRVARVVRPIAIEGTCVLCHGAPDALAPGVRELLDRRYPADRATGYRVGDLRGALWAEAPVR